MNAHQLESLNTVPAHEAALYLGLSPQQLVAAIQSRHLKAFKVGYDYHVYCDSIRHYQQNEEHYSLDIGEAAA